MKKLLFLLVFIPLVSFGQVSYDDTMSIESVSAKDSIDIMRVMKFQENAWNIGDINSFMEGYIKSDELVLRTSGSKSSKKLSLIQNVDKKIPLDEISESRGVEFDILLLELESIVFSGTKLDIDYYVDDILDEDQQEQEYIDYKGQKNLTFQRAEAGKSWSIAYSLKTNRDDYFLIDRDETELQRNAYCLCCVGM